MTPRILVVDDNPRWCRTLRHIIEDVGYEAHTAACLSEARQCLNSIQFDRALVDIDLDGLGLAGEGGRLFDLLCEQYPRIAVIAITATSPSPAQMRDLFVEYRIRDFISKDSFDVKRFRELIYKKVESEGRVDPKSEIPTPLTAGGKRGLSLAEERAWLREGLAQHKRNLYTLREQAAVFAAGDTPLHLRNQIEAEEEEIRRIEADLERLER